MQSQYEADQIAKMKQEEAEAFFKKEYGPMKKRIMLQPKQDKKKMKNKRRQQKQSKRKNR